MKLKIKNIIIWPKDETKQKRVIPFETEKVNIITGESHKGKSALVHIIDYCLGSDKCTIPVGIIRDKTLWFAVHFLSDKTELLLARKEPGDQISTDEMYLDEAIKIDISIQPRQNTNRKNVINRLNQLSGFSTERFDSENFSNQFKSAASFRDTSAFQFQPQHIVANPNTLFYKADTFEHQQKLRTVFPLFLGSTTNEILSLEREIKELENNLKVKKLNFNTKKQAVEAWFVDLQTLYLKASDLGLLMNLFDNNIEMSVAKYVSILYEVLENFKNNPIPLYNEGSTEESVSMLSSLLNSEQELQSEINVLKVRLTRLKKLNNSGQGYKETIIDQQSRLEPISWFRNRLNGDICPFCESKNNKALEQIRELEVVSQRLESLSKNITTNDINLDKEIAELVSRIQVKEGLMNSARTVIRETYVKSSEENKQRQSIEDIYRYIGRLEQSLKNVENTSIDSELEKEINKLEEGLRNKQAELREKKQKNQLDNILQRISVLISNYISKLDIDRPDDLVKLDIQNLTVKIVSPESRREDFLWEVGSGANWMGYHLSTLFALHEHFLSLKHNHVPSFLLIDQPSQVYFPEKFPNVGQDITTYQQFEESSEDLKQTRKIFIAASECLRRLQYNIQIIIFEHAPKITWEGIPDIHLVSEWKGENALIPITWN